jgi:hypothetical protein
MDDRVEVEGPPESIEQGILVIGLDRSGYSADRLTDFVARYESRTGQPALLGNP